MLSAKRSAEFIAVMLVCVGCAVISGCTKSPAEKHAKFMESGKQYFAQKDYQRAIIEFTNASQIRPNDAETQYQLAMADWGAGRFKEAYVGLKKATEINPSHAEAQTKLAELMATSRDPKLLAAAGEHAAQAATLAPGSAESQYAVALTEYRQGKKGDAEQQLKTTLGKFPKHFQSAAGLATVKLENKDFQGAEQVLKQAAAAAPQAAEPALALGRVYEMEGKTADAEAEYRRVLQREPNNGEALLQLAGLQLRAGKKDEAEQIYKQISKLPGDSQAMHAFFLVDQGRNDEATAEFERLWKEEPKNSLARRRLVTALMVQNRLNEAQEILAAAIKSNPKDTSALFQRSELYIKLGKYAQAQEDLTQIVRSQPDYAEAHYLLAEIHKARRADLLQKQELDTALKLKPNLLVARVALANSFVSSKNPKAALDLLDRAPEDQKKQTALIVARNWALLATGNHVSARQGIDQGSSESKSPDLLVQDAMLKIEQKDYEGGRSVLESLLQQSPENVAALQILARSYLMQKNPALASQKIREYAAMRPGSASLQIFAGNWLLRNGNRSDARAAFTAARTAEPGNPAPELALAEIDRAEGKLDSARSRLTGVLASEPQNLGAHLILAMLEDGAGNFTEAISHYRKVVELDSRQIIALNGLAYALGSHTNQLDEALKYAQSAKELDQSNPATDDTLGWIYYRMGHYPRALERLQSAAAKDQNPVIKYHLAMAYFKTGDVRQGQQILSAAMQLNTNLPEAAQAQEVFRQSLLGSR